MLDFVDLTGEPGPRFWKERMLPRGPRGPSRRRRQLARGRGLRPLGRKTSADRRRVGQGRQLARPHLRQPNASNAGIPGAKRWIARGRTCGVPGPRRTVPVREFSEGVSVGGVYQLIGNVWEWTHATFHGGDGAATTCSSTRR